MKFPVCKQEVQEFILHHRTIGKIQKSNPDLLAITLNKILLNNTQITNKNYVMVLSPTIIF